MNVIKLYVLAALILIAGSLRAQSVDDIMEKHEKAIGGIENWNKVKTLKMTGSMSIQGMDISITQTMDIGNAMRTDISAMGMNGFTIVTPKRGYMYMPMQGSTTLDTMKPDMLEASRKQLDFKSTQMLDYRSNGSKAEYTGKDTINSTPCYKVKLTDKDGNESVSFFDIATYYLLRTEAKVKQDDQETEVAVVYSSFKKMDEGIVLPTSISANGAEITFKSIEINKPIDQNVFVPKISN